MDTTAAWAFAAGACGAGVLGLMIGRALARRGSQAHASRIGSWLEALDDADASMPAGPPPPPAGTPLHSALQQHAGRLAARRATEVSQRRQYAADTLEALQQADAALRTRQRFLDAANHDLRQPLQALQLGLARLQARQEAGIQAELLPMHEAMAGIETLLDRWLQLSRLDAGDLRPAPTHCELQELFDQAVARHRAQADAAGVRLLARGRGLSVLADARLLAQLLDCLVENAIRATGPGGCVLVTARMRGPRLRLEVRDNGIGIAPVHQGRVFDEFFQVGNSERDRRKGIGLGLALAARLAAAMGSRIGLSSRLHGGSCFHLLLAHGEVQGGAPVLLMDRQAERRQWLLGLLASWGYRVQAHSDPQALQATLTGTGGRRPHALLCALEDALDPGWEVLATATRRVPTLPRAVMAERPTAEMLDRANQLEAPLLSTPVAVAKLRALLSGPATTVPGAA